MKNINRIWQGLLILSLFVFSPTVTFAGMISLISAPVLTNLTSENKTENIEKLTENSQNMTILSPDLMNQELSKGGAEIRIVENSALLASSGTVGINIESDKPKNGGKISVYEVREGDTLSQIAQMFDVSVNTIRWANDFSGSIQPGQKLVILPVTGITHTVKNGGTIKDIAEIYHADVREIALFNGIDEGVDLKPGDEIIVPNVDPAKDDEDDHDHGNSSVKVYAKASVDSGSYYINPLPGGIITQGLHGYNAVDLGAPAGTPIYAAASGKVITSKAGGWNGGYGSYIVISHPNGTQTLYSHQSSNAVYVGQVVEQGEVIGYVGSTGRSTGNHLHFEVRGAKNPLAR